MMDFPVFGSVMLPAVEVFDLFDRDQPDTLELMQDDAIVGASTTPYSTSTENNSTSSGHPESQARKGRKGHTKSRTGCLVCKKRRIKCQETKPSCNNCVKAGFGCEYPRPKTLESLAIVPSRPMLIGDNMNESTVTLFSNLARYNYTQHYVTNPLKLMPPLQTTPTTFTPQDMMLFHCFLTRSYPHLPFKADKLWTLDLPAYAHEHTYLMHAMLALGAAHMAEYTSESFAKDAINHRIKAISGLNAALVTRPKDVHEWDARYATLVALSIQAASMTDGVVDFFTTLRGCIIAGEPYDDSSAFSQFVNFGRMRVTQPKMMNDEGFGVGDFTAEAEQLVGEAITAIEACEELVIPGTDEHTFWTLLLQCVRNAIICPADTYQAMSQIYDTICTCSAAQFAEIVDTNNTVSWLLISLSFGVHLLLRHCGAFSFYDGGPSKMRYTKRQWIRGIDERLPSHLKKYNLWALTIAERKEAELLADADRARGRREC